MSVCVQGVANRDLKLENLLLDRKDTGSRPLLKICDFGYSKVLTALTKCAKLTLLANGAGPEFIHIKDVAPLPQSIT